MLDELAKRLKVRTITDIGWKLTRAQNNPGDSNSRIDGVKYEYRDVPDDVKRKFVSLLENESGEFTFGYGKGNRKYNHNTRCYPIVASGANKELKEVFEKLPALPEGEEYAFPCNTIFVLPVPRKDSKNWNEMSPWVKATIMKAENQ